MRPRRGPHHSGERGLEHAFTVTDWPFLYYCRVETQKKLYYCRVETQKKLSISSRYAEFLK